MLHRSLQSGQALELTHSNQRNLPIIFIAHSLGGLIIQDALSSPRKVIESSLMNRIRGIIYLGTPFFTRRLEWIQFINSLTKATKATQGPDPRKLIQLQDASVNFREWLKTTAGTRISIWCFFESLPIYRIGIVSILLKVRHCLEEAC